MPPTVARKRLRSASPITNGARVTKTPPKAREARPPPRKSTLFEDLESGVKTRSAEKTRSALQQMEQDDESDSSSLSSLSDAEFEDVPAAKRQRVDHGEAASGSEEDEDEDDDDDVEFEDVPNHEPRPDPVPSGDLELTLYQENVPMSMNSAKKGPSKREKQIRNLTHCLHVQFLLWHNAIRNAWLCDPEVQAVMISHLTPRLWDEVERWRRNSGLDVPEKDTSQTPRGAKGKAKAGKGKGKGSQQPPKQTRNWSAAAERLERGAPDMSHGDPLFRLVKSLSAWWKQRFRITAPGLRKLGYMEIRRLAKIRGEFQDEENDPEKFGERIAGLDEFRRHAQDCAGSRDVGSQLFTALLRGLGLEARMVANLQCLGYAFAKSEDAEDGNPLKGTNAQTPNAPAGSKAGSAKKAAAATRPARRRTRNHDKEALTMDLDDSDEFAEIPSEDSDDSSVVDVTSEHSNPPPVSKTYDKDLEFPHYWTEVLSPITLKYLPVDPIVKSVIGTSRELIESLEPRGGKADKAKQVMAYAVGFSPDGTAKDVTVRYLRKQLYPGRTKGVRIPVEKVPIYNKHGKVKRHEQFDWFKTVMSGYTRGGKKHPITEVDEVEDTNDLRPAVVEKKEVKEGEETLQYYKQSKEYVLRRHLKREEALLPSATSVRVFTSKGKGGKTEEEDVFLRKDVVEVKSAETWHKQGRAPLPNAEPLKHAPYRAATTNRRREIAEAEARTGEKVMQPLYSFDQTDWIIPEPIKDGIIPKNGYGNIDMFAEHMCPEGAVHLPYRGAVRVCKRLGIDYAEAVVGFEFGHRMAVPVIQGVVIAEEHEERVLEEIEKDEAERKRKEDEKRRKAALGMWRKFMMGLRVANRLKQDYAHVEDTEIYSKKKTREDADAVAMREKDEDLAGGFLPEGHDEDDEEEAAPARASNYFPVAEDGEDGEGDDPFEIE